MRDREIWTLGVETLTALLKDDLVLARALRGRDDRRLYAVATVAQNGLSEALAITDPRLYRRLSQAIVLMNIKGYGSLDLGILRSLMGAE